MVLFESAVAIITNNYDSLERLDYSSPTYILEMATHVACSSATNFIYVGTTENSVKRLLSAPFPFLRNSMSPMYTHLIDSDVNGNVRSSNLDNLEIKPHLQILVFDTFHDDLLVVLSHKDTAQLCE